MADIRRISGGGGTYSGQTFHGLRRDDDGLLYYNHVGINQSGVTVNLTDGSVLDDSSQAQGYRNDKERSAGVVYDQWLIDQDLMNFYIDNNGFLIVKLNEAFTPIGPT